MSGSEFIVLLILRSFPPIVMGVILQFLIFEKLQLLKSRPAGKVGALAFGAILAAVISVGLCLLFPALTRNALTMRFPESLLFVPGLLGVAAALLVVNMWVALKRTRRTN